MDTSKTDAKNFDLTALLLRQKLRKYFLIILLLISCINNSFAKEAMAGDKIWINDIGTKARKEIFKSLEQKYQRLKGLQVRSGEINKRDATLQENDLLRVFVSSSMSSENLQAYLQMAKKYQAILVFNGLPGGSFKELAKIIIKITENKDRVNIQIDDVAFRKFKVNSVPTIILSKENWLGFKEDEELIFDKVVGNIPIVKALKLFAENGDLKLLAEKRLQR
ncbi:MAG: type-F conjugative transfer system pilin assembly protein TrbC [Rickettsiaceae bacterium]|nr:type-F conjugative transfer system pilin assembly protein TrbC [Rickettsiaceae bacterium]